MIRFATPCRALLALLLGLAAATPMARDRAPSVEQLMAAYLACDRLMSRQRVEPALAQRCAAVGERLLQRGFDGDFERLIAWWQGARAPIAAAAGEAGPP